VWLGPLKPFCPDPGALIDKYICLDMRNIRWCNAPMNVAANAAPSGAWDLVADMNRASALLHPLRLRILDALREPDSASGLARRFRLPRQKMNYHVRELARTHFLERAGQRRRRNMIERRYRTTAQGYVLSPELLGRMGLPHGHAVDVFSAAYLLGIMAAAQAELARASREASAQRKRLTTLSLSSELRFESAEQRAKFAEELRHSVIEVIGRYASPHTAADGSAGPGRPYRLVLGCYPIPPKIAADEK
jgi:DNA-binding transcriptional ArsR family regulator